MTHSQLPWKDNDRFAIHDKQDRAVGFAWEEVDVAFIVHCVNNHERLVGALKEAFSLQCSKDDCRVNSKQVNHDYCIKHKKILQALQSAEKEK